MRRVQGARIAVCLVLGMGLTGQAWAKRNYGLAGCGLGSVVIGSNGGQISAATTNSTFYSQAFGISSGTSNCIPTQEMAVIMKQEQFLAANLNTLQKEMAQGSGETLSECARLLFDVRRLRLHSAGCGEGSGRLRTHSPRLAFGATACGKDQFEFRPSRGHRPTQCRPLMHVHEKYLIGRSPR